MPGETAPQRQKLWKADQAQWLPRLVGGEPYPGRDEEGEVCYDNTHFPTIEAAWGRLEAIAAADVAVAVEAPLTARCRLREIKVHAAQAAADSQRLNDNRRKMAISKGATNDV